MPGHPNIGGTQLHGSRAHNNTRDLLGTGSPVGRIVPSVRSEIYHDEAANTVWLAIGPLDTDWIVLGGIGSGGIGDCAYFPNGARRNEGAFNANDPQAVVWGGCQGASGAAIEVFVTGRPVEFGRTTATQVVGGLTFPMHRIRVNVTGFNVIVSLILPVPPGATSINQITLDHNVVVYTGPASGSAVFRYLPLNGGALKDSPTRSGIVAADAPNTLFTQTIAAPIAAPTPGHCVEIRFFTTLAGATGDITIDWTNLVIGWR